MKLPPALALLLVSCCSTWADAQAIGNQFVGIEANLIFARGAAEAGDIDDVLARTLKFFSTTQSSIDFRSITSYCGFVLCSVKK